MKKVFCSNCREVVREDDILGIGTFDHNVGRYAGLTVISFKCSNCSEKEYQVVDRNPFDKTLDVSVHPEMSPEEMIILQREPGINSDDQLDFYNEVEELDSIEEFLVKCNLQRYEKTTDIGELVDTPEDVYNLFIKYNGTDKRRMMVLFLDDESRLVTWELFGKGTNKNINFDPKHIFRLALMLPQKVSIILAHNHFTHISSPSKKDILRTKRLVKAGDLLGIDFLDHVIIHKEGFKSFDQLNLI